MKVKISHITPLLFAVAILFVSCTKNCDCIVYDDEGNATDETVVRQMPRSLKLECSFFDTATDTTGGILCK
ncbi:hypothetical protein LJC53_02105 [Bacteroidales bacterium OttesenSCG-928-C03]|nr:hypothetical protein [Bacteroidales bacterium OttesenSCG-928-C03]